MFTSCLTRDETMRNTEVRLWYAWACTRQRNLCFSPFVQWHPFSPRLWHGASPEKVQNKQARLKWRGGCHVAKKTCKMRNMFTHKAYLHYGQTVRANTWNEQRRKTTSSTSGGKRRQGLGGYYEGFTEGSALRRGSSTTVAELEQRKWTFQQGKISGTHKAVIHFL